MIERLQNCFRPSLRRVLLTVFKREFLGSLILLFAYGMRKRHVARGFVTLFLLGCLSFINPIILPFLIIYVNDYNVPTYAGFIYIFCIIIAQLVGSFCYYLGQFKGAIVGLDVRIYLLLFDLTTLINLFLGAFGNGHASIPKSANNGAEKRRQYGPSRQLYQLRRILFGRHNFALYRRRCWSDPNHR